MRLGITIAIALLVLPNTWATPLLDEGPAPFTYEIIEGPNYKKMVMYPEVAYHDGKVGVAWLQNDYTPGWASFNIQVAIRDGATTIRHVIDSGWYPYVTFDGQGRFHVMYQTGTFDDVDVLVDTFDGTSWTTRLIDHAFVARGVAALEHDGQPYFLARVNDVDGRLLAGKSRIYTLDPGTDEWIILATHPTFVYVYPDFDIDSRGRIHLLWGPNALSLPPEGYHDFYSIYENGTWTDSAAPYGTSAWSAGDLSIGPNDLPYFVYNDANRNLHLYAPNANGEYVDELVDTRRGDYPIIRVDPQGIVHILSEYVTLRFDIPTEESQYYHRRDPIQGWSTQPLVPVTRQVGGAMVLDGDGQPVIAIANSRLQTVERLDVIKEVSSLVIARPVHRAADGFAAPGW